MGADHSSFLFSVSPGHIGNLLRAFTHVQEIRPPRAQWVFLISAGRRPDAQPLACGDKKWTSSALLPVERLLKQKSQTRWSVRDVGGGQSHSAAALQGCWQIPPHGFNVENCASQRCQRWCRLSHSGLSATLAASISSF